MTSIIITAVSANLYVEELHAIKNGCFSVFLALLVKEIRNSRRDLEIKEIWHFIEKVTKMPIVKGYKYTSVL
jgi:hypothetical protein